MPGAFRYNLASIEQAGDSITSCSSNMEQIGADMYTALRGILGDRLNGHIAEAVESTHHNWDGHCADFIDAERRFAQRVAAAGQNMHAADQQAARRIYNI